MKREMRCREGGYDRRLVVRMRKKMLRNSVGLDWFGFNVSFVD